jgi:hypothetical protein
MDSESLGVLQRTAASEAGLPAQFAHRVNGQSIAELRQDARQLALDLGYAEPPARDQRGRFQRTSGQRLSGQAFNDAVRRMAGYAVAGDEPTERPTGNLGIGVGGGAQERPRPAPDMNSLIRGTLNARRGVEWQFAEQIASARP